MPGFPQLVNEYTRLFKSQGEKTSSVPVPRASDGREGEPDAGHGHNSTSRDDQ